MYKKVYTLCAKKQRQVRTLTCRCLDGFETCDPAAIRTRDRLLRRQMLYPAELPDHLSCGVGREWPTPHRYCGAKVVIIFDFANIGDGFVEKMFLLQQQLKVEDVEEAAEFEADLLVVGDLTEAEAAVEGDAGVVFAGDAGDEGTYAGGATVGD